MKKTANLMIKTRDHSDIYEANETERRWSRIYARPASLVRSRHREKRKKGGRSGEKFISDGHYRNI